jgi:hypothetical protein
MTDREGHCSPDWHPRRNAAVGIGSTKPINAIALSGYQIGVSIVGPHVERSTRKRYRQSCRCVLTKRVIESRSCSYPGFAYFRCKPYRCLCEVIRLVAATREQGSRALARLNYYGLPTRETDDRAYGAYPFAAVSSTAHDLIDRHSGLGQFDDVGIVFSVAVIAPL